MGFGSIALPLVGSVLGGVLAGQGTKGGGGRPAPIDVSNLQRLITEGATKQREQAVRIRPEARALQDEFGRTVQAKLGALSTKREQQKSSFLQALQADQSKIGSTLFNTLQERIFAGVPAAEARIREQAGGAFQTGATQELLAQPTIQASQQLGRSAQDISMQQQQQVAAAQEKLFNLDQEFLSQQFGVEKGVLEAALNSGRQDLINEANALIDIADQETADQLSVEKFGLSGGIAQDTAARKASADRRTAQAGLGTELLTTLLPSLLESLSKKKT